MATGETRARRQVLARACGLGAVPLCEICGAAYGTDFHHRRNRSQGGLWTPSNGLQLCREHHAMVTDTGGRRAEFEASGWIVPSHADPARVPVLACHWPTGRRWVLLDPNGTTVPSSPSWSPSAG